MPLLSNKPKDCTKDNNNNDCCLVSVYDVLKIIMGTWHINYAHLIIISHMS